MIAAELTNSSADFGQIEPMVNAARRELHAAGVADVPQVIVADAGYWHQVQIQALASDGIQVLIPPDANKRKGPRPGWTGGLYAFMRRVLATPTAAGLYRKRTAMIEPVFADTKIDRFQRRGRARLPLGMAADHRHPQSPQALARHHPGSHRLKRPPRRPPFPTDAAKRASAPSPGNAQPLRNSLHG